jgi:hypothetical protein
MRFLHRWRPDTMADHPVLQPDGQFGSFWPKHGDYTTIHWFPRVIDVENP